VAKVLADQATLPPCDPCPCALPQTTGGQVGLVGEDLNRALQAQGRKWLRRAQDTARAIAPDITVTTRIACTGDVPLLVDESERAWLVVLGSRGLGGFSDLLVGSTALALVSHGKCPVVVARRPTDPWSSAWTAHR
jgi:nucleotide-binding universal stress UspA family protein